MPATINIALLAARSAAKAIALATNHPHKIKVQYKSAHDYVSDIDCLAEEKIIAVIKKYYPQHSILSEESGLSVGKMRDMLWVIDPIDGTTNFIHSLPHFAVSIAFLERGVPYHAVIADPMRNEEFVASRGDGAYLNDRRIRVAQHHFKDALFASGNPADNQHKNYTAAYRQCLDEIVTHCAGVRRHGSSVLDMAYVACGRLDGFWDVGMKPWDIAAGILLVQEAGGMVSNLAGGAFDLRAGHVACAANSCYDPLLQVVKKYLGDCIAPLNGDMEDYALLPQTNKII